MSDLLSLFFISDAEYNVSDKSLQPVSYFKCNLPKWQFVIYILRHKLPYIYIDNNFANIKLWFYDNEKRVKLRALKANKAGIILGIHAEALTSPLPPLTTPSLSDCSP